MKKVVKLISIVFICLLLICGCKDKPVEEPGNEEPPVKEVTTADLEKKITTTRVALFDGEFGSKTIVLKVQNDNNQPVYVNYSIEVFDKNKTKLYNKEVFVRVGSLGVAYAVAYQDPEESTFDSYTYKMSVMKETLQDYDAVKNAVKSSYRDTGKSIVVSITNSGKRTTTVYDWLFFYKENKLVAVKEATSYNLIPYKTDSITVDYPIKTIKEKIAFDRVVLVTNEVSTEL